MRRKKQNNRRAMLFVMFVLIILMGVGFVQISNAYMENLEREKEVQALIEEIEKEELIQLELMRTKEELKTRTFIEQTAHKNFGLIYPDWIIIDTTEAK